MKLKIEVHDNQTVFRSGQPIQGNVRYEDRTSGDQTLSIRLFWYTTGKGDRDVQIVDTVDVDWPEVDWSGAVTKGRLPFEFVAGHRPHSMSGKLIAVSWAIEAIVYPSQATVIHEIVISPTGRPIVLRDQNDQLKQFGIKDSWLKKLSP